MYTSSYPNVAAYCNRLRETGSRGPFFRVKGVPCSINPNPGTKQYIISNLDSTAVQHNTVKVCIKIISNLDMESEFTAE